MSGKAKVGSWLESTSTTPQDEAYDSPSDAESSTSQTRVAKNEKAAQNPIEYDDDELEEDDNDTVGREEDIDWDAVLPLVRGAMLDKSKKRRTAFISRYLYVTGTSPPDSQVGPLVGRLLACLPNLLLPEQADGMLKVMKELIERDERQGSPMKLGDKLAKSVCAEAEKLASTTKAVTSSAFTPFILAVVAILSTLARSRQPLSQFTSTPVYQELILTLAGLLDAFETQLGILSSAKATRIRRKLGIRTWRVLRELRDGLADTLRLLVTKSTPNPARLAVLIGHTAGVILRLNDSRKQGGVKLPNGNDQIDIQKDAVLSFYSSHILGAKAALPGHVPAAFDEFIQHFVTFEDLKSKLLPVAERMLLRSPEVALPLTGRLLSSCAFDITPLLPGKLVAAGLSSSKSTNGETRQKAVHFVDVLTTRCTDTAALGKIAIEILALPKTGKSASAEHRICLFDMAASLPPSDEVSSIVVETLPPLISKEGNELALNALCSALTVHLSYLVTSTTSVSPNSVNALEKELISAKLPARRGAANSIGSAFWAVHEKGSQMSNEGAKLLQTLATPLAACLTSAAGNAPVNAGGFLEGYVAIALAIGPLSQAAGVTLASSPELSTILTAGAKPSFLLNEKVHARLPAMEDEIWLLRSLEMLVTHLSDKLTTQGVRTAVGLALIHLAFESKHARVRREAYAAVARVSQANPKPISRIIREALTAWLKIQDAKVAKASVQDEDEGTKSKSREIGRLLQATTHACHIADQTIREDIAVDLLILAHHPDIGDEAQVSWVGLVQSLKLDPASVAFDLREKIFKRLWDAAAAPPADSHLAEAAFRAITTLCLVCPDIYIEAILSQLKEDLDSRTLDFIGPEEKGIWDTPEGELYVDALSNKKTAVEDKNSKDYATKKWEQEVRDSLSKKKAASNGITLTKEQKALVAAQQAKETEIRARIRQLQARLARGVQLVRSLVVSSAERVTRHVGILASSMIESVFGPAAFLADERAFPVFIQLSTLMSDRLGEYRRLSLAATLRSLDSPLVPSDYLDESLGELVTRLLHQLQFVAAQSPFDGSTYTLLSFLLARVVKLGGVGVASSSSEEAQEQLTLVVNIIASCCGEFADESYPRSETVKLLIDLISTYPRLGKDAASALIDLGDAIKDVASPAESRQLILGTLSKDSLVRNAALQALQPVDLTDFEYSEELWIAVHDNDEQNASLASHLWEDNGLDVPETYLASLLTYLTHDSLAVRTSTASALAAAAQQYPSQVVPTLEGLQAMYVDKARLLQPEYDQFGMIILETVDRQDPFEARVAIGLSIEKLAPLLPQESVMTVFDFFVSREALGDRHGQVRKAMLAAASALVDLHGGSHVAELMKMFETTLASGAKSDTADYIQEAVVILFGRLAKHLEASDPRIPQVVDRLVEALNTPSELVQSAVADCLPPLVAGMGEEVEYLVDKLFSTLTTGSKYAARRGAAYGLAGVVKGRGLASLKEYEVMDKLKEAAEDKSAYQTRQGALFAFETLSSTLGRAFEPYIISIIPLMLALFGDANADVREATSDAAKVIMSRVSGHCVKLMLPTLLSGLEEKQWRTKKGSIELLGSMAFCAPRQLSLSLPTIIPQLTGVINDSHSQVKSAANTSLKQFGEVLNNPEVKAIQSTLMKALADPTANIGKALTALLRTSFEHYLDAPSLALVMPIIDRGLRQRSSEIKRRSVQIVGNMASLTESRDLIPYLHELMPLVHEVLVDPVPEARATAAKSLGTLVERLGESNFPNLVNDLVQTLKSDTSGVDRQGAAQGLSEVLSGLGMERMEGLLPDVISSTSSPRAYVREGFISLLVYLPATFGHRFSPHLGRVIPPILNGLADDSEYVREASMRAGKMIIANYSSKAIDLLLPELEKGMLDGSWRIRQSSISLTGELLYRVTGISGKVELEEEEVPAHGADNARKALLEALGPDRRDRVLATLYIVRQDNVSTVRQASIHIWKALVQNTPRTTREILPVLMQLIMGLLGDPHVEQQETASRTLGELCRKNGERIFAEIVPILQKAISAPDVATREGACLAFADVMAASNKDAMADHEGAIISAIRSALVDEEASVRSAAAKTFDAMQHFIGNKAVDQTIPTLLEAMRNPGSGSETALQALKEVMSVRANSVFPVLIPTLIAQPISAFNARALGSLVKVAGSALNRRLDTLLSALVKSLETEKSEDILIELKGAIESLLAAVTDSDGVHLLEMLLMEWAKDRNATRRATACNIFGTFCQVSSADTSDYRVDWIRILITLFADPNEVVVNAAWESLEKFVKTVPQDDLKDLVVPLRRTMESTTSAGTNVPGFCRPKGVQSIVPILLAGVLSGTQEQREQAALGVGDVVQRTSEAAIKPYIIQLTGPLIRVISGAGIAPQIKTAILSALTVLLEEVPQLVRPFHPQLTRTFVKSASDPAALSIRNRAAAGLGELMKHQPRVDPLITELIGGVKAGDKDIAPSMAQALAAVCNSAGKNIGTAAKAAIIDLVEDAFLAQANENYNVAIAKVVAGLAKHDAANIQSIVDTFLAAPTPPLALVSVTILTCLEDCPDVFFDLDVAQDIAAKVSSSVASDSSSIARPAREARDLLRKGKYGEDPAVQAALR